MIVSGDHPLLTSGPIRVSPRFQRRVSAYLALCEIAPTKCAEFSPHQPGSASFSYPRPCHPGPLPPAHPQPGQYLKQVAVSGENGRNETAKVPQNKTRTPLASGGRSKRRSKTRGDKLYLSSLAPGEGASPIHRTLAAEDATTNSSAKTQEPRAQEQKARWFRRDDADARILNCSDWSNDSVDNERRAATAVDAIGERYVKLDLPLTNAIRSPDLDVGESTPRKRKVCGGVNQRNRTSRRVKRQSRKLADFISAVRVRCRHKRYRKRPTESPRTVCCDSSHAVRESAVVDQQSRRSGIRHCLRRENGNRQQARRKCRNNLNYFHHSVSPFRVIDHCPIHVSCCGEPAAKPITYVNLVSRRKALTHSRPPHTTPHGRLPTTDISQSKLHSLSFVSFC